MVDHLKRSFTDLTFGALSSISHNKTSISNEKLRKNSKSSLKQHLNPNHKSLTAINTMTSSDVSPNIKDYKAKMEAIAEMAKDNENLDKNDEMERKFEVLAKRIDTLEERLSNQLQEVMDGLKLVMRQTCLETKDQSEADYCDQYSSLICDKPFDFNDIEKDGDVCGPPLSRSQSLLQCTSLPLTAKRIRLRNSKSLMQTMYELSSPNLLLDINDISDLTSERHEINDNTFNYSLGFDNTLEYVSSIENTMESNRMSKQSEPVLNRVVNSSEPEMQPILTRALSLQSCFPSKANNSRSMHFSDPLAVNPLLESINLRTFDSSSANESDGQTVDTQCSSLTDHSSLSTQLLNK